MIEINLIPEASRKKKKARGPVAAAASAISRERIIAFSGGMILLLVVIHVVLQMAIGGAYVNYHGTQKQIAALQGQTDAVQRVARELKTLQGQMKSLAPVHKGFRFSWAQKLNEISRLLPRGVWLTRLEFQDDTMTINGSAVSKDEPEMVGVHQFMSNLKESPEFMKAVTQIEMGLIKSRKINMTSVSDFTITVGTIKPEKAPVQVQKK